MQSYHITIRFTRKLQADDHMERYQSVQSPNIPLTVSTRSRILPRRHITVGQAGSVVGKPGWWSHRQAVLAFSAVGNFA